MTLRERKPSPHGGEPTAGGAPAPGGPVRRLPRRGGTERFPASLTQERLWFLERLRPCTAAHNAPGALVLEGRLDLPALAAALVGVAQRHESLRTTFELGEGGPVQVVAAAARVALPVVDLSALPPDRREPAAAECVRAGARRPFDLVAGPLLRAVVVRTAAARHTLAVTVHQIVADGRSLGVLFREAGELYRARVTGSPAHLPELPVQYADHAVWQREWLQGAVLDERLAAWRDRLDGAPPLLELPADRHHPPVQSLRGGTRKLVVPGDLLRRLEEVAAGAEATRLMGLLALFYALLHRVTGQDDLVVGTAVAGRDRAETERLIGPFRNVLPLRTRLGGAGTSFLELLDRVREVARDASERADVPFGKLVSELDPERDRSRAALVQALVAEEDADPGDPDLPGLRLSRATPETGTIRFDLVLVLAEAGRGPARRLEGALRYSRDLFDDTTVARTAERFVRLARAALAEPARPLGGLPLVTPAERHQLLEWNDTGVERAVATLHGLIRRQAERTPDRIAVTTGGRCLTYGGLVRRAGQLAHRLRGLGVGPGVPVAVAAERSVDLMVALLGVLEAEAAYLPLDPGYPEERLRFMLEDSGVGVVVAQRRLAAALPIPGVRLVILEEEADAGPAPGVPVRPPEPDPDALAYVIYTSGSTGRPKGVMNAHRGIVNRLLWMQERYRLAEDDRVLQKTPVSFDVSVWELFWPLLVGARLVMARPEGHKDPGYLVRTIQAEGITTIHFVPSMLHAFVEAPGLDGCRSLRRVVASGEALSRELAERLFRRLGTRARLENLYGPTEAAVDVTSWPCRPGGAGLSVPIGRPVAGTAVHVLDPSGEPVPPGVPGELSIGGVQVARGYLGRPGLTAGRFVPDGRSGTAGARLYRTGDLARFRPDGALEFLGRTDHQVKVRGFRIEPGEIEAALAELPGVAEAAVLARPAGGDGGAPRLRLVGYVAAPDGGTDPEALRRALAERLPEHMVPASFVVLERLPLNPSGKVDRGALSQIEARIEPGARAAGGEKAGPRTPVERRLAELWRDVLDSPPPGPDDSFFDLGGDSIRAAVLVNRIQEELGEILHVVAVFDHPTLEGLAAFLERDYPEALARAWGVAAAPAGSPVRTAARPAGEDPAVEGGPEGRLARGQPDEAGVLEIRRLVDTYRVGAAPPSVRNRRAVFVLTPPRSGSTLLRVMMAGHPGLLAPPELNLLTFDTMGARRREFSGRDSFRLEGLIRAVMATHVCDADEARRVLARFEDADAGVELVYRELQDRIGDRLLVDKTPSYFLYRSVLERAEEVFDEPLYVHLVRHPCAVIRSFEEAHLEQVFFRHEHAFSRRDLAELMWVAGHRTVAERFGLLPRERWHRVRFEDLVRNPEEELRALCDFLGLEYEPAMADPYDDPVQRMTDGLYAESRMLGDVKFHRHSGVNPEAADRWRETHSEEDLGDPARALAADLGYDPPPRRRGAARTRRGAMPELTRRFEVVPGARLPVSSAQERLWVLDRLDPGSGVYNTPAAFALHGRLDPDALRRAFAEVVRRHAVLRSRLVEEGGSPVQVVEAAPPWRLPVVDLSGLPAGRRRRELRAVSAAEARRPFRLDQAPLLRSHLVRLAEEEHAVLATMHHIASDGWSVGVLAREVAKAYAELAAGRRPRLPALPVQYADYAAWHREWLAEGLEDRLDTWRRALAGAPELLELPADRPRPPRPSGRGELRRAGLPADLVEGLRSLAADRGGTLFMGLLAGLAALLGRLSGQDDLVVGTPVAGRPRRELEGLIGFFVNTLPLRTRLDGEPAFAELVDRAREAATAAFRHQETPFEKVVEAVRPGRDPSHAPLFQVLLALQNARSTAEVPGLRLERLEPITGTGRFDLAFLVAEVRGQLVCTLDYTWDLFDATTAERFLRAFRTLLAGAVAAPETPVSRLPLLEPAAARQVLVEWNDTAAPPERHFPDGPFLHRAVGERARAAPDAVAVEWPGPAGAVTWSYGFLRDRTRALARILAARGVGPEVLVGLALERTPDLVLGALAVLEAGGAWLPLDPAYPAERLRFMVEDSRPRLVLARRGRAPELPAGGAEPLLLEEAAAETGAATAGGGGSGPGPGGGAGAGGGAEAALRPGNLAYVIYTSGSTGRPKGVALSHRGLWNLCAAQAARYGPRPGDRVLQFAPASFDAAVSELSMALGFGAGLVLPADRHAILPGEPLLDLLRRHRVTRVTLPPSALAALPEPGEADLPALETLIVAGEACPPELARAWSRPRSSNGRALLHNAYGPTEATVWATVEPYRDPAARLTIGRPVENVRTHLVDRRGQAVAAGVPGELWIGGPGLARGYLSRPGLTAERFVPDPFVAGAGGPGRRLYRTGDLARHLPDGRIDFLGRLDHQVKIRGFRIELGEVEAVLAAAPEVAESVVAPRRDGGTGPDAARLVAYVIPREPAGEPGDLRSGVLARAAEALPDYMVPSAVVVLPEMPRTPAGKVDREALPAPHRTRRVDPADPAGPAGPPPEGATERRVAEVWAELLGADPGVVSRDDSFFELGGHSLLATRVVSRLREAVGVDLPVRLLFERPLLADLAAEVDARSAADTARPAPPSLRPVPRDGPPALSFAQERLWFLEQLHPGQVAYNIPMPVRLRGSLDLPALRRALDGLLERHEALRTTFAAPAGTPVQVIAPAASVPLPVVDLGRLDGSAALREREAELRRLVAAEASRPFDLEAGPLFRVILVRLARSTRPAGPTRRSSGGAAAGEHALLLDVHHAVADGWSAGVLFRDLGALYGAALDGARPEPPPLPVQYADFALWQRGWLSGPVLEEQSAYWRQALAGLPDLLPLPTDRPRPRVQGSAGGAVPVVLGPRATSGAEALGRERGASPFMVLLAAFQALLGRYAGQDDLAVGSPVANRTHPDLEDLVGFFVNTLVLRGDLAGEPTFVELVDRAREIALGAYAHQDVPFEKLVEELRPGRSLDHSPLFQVMLALQDAPMGPLGLPGLELDPLEEASPAAKFDLTLSLAERGGSFAGTLQYRRELFDPTTADRLARHLRTLLEGAVARPDLPLRELPLLSPAERLQLIEWNDTAVPHDGEVLLLHELVAAQADRTPDAVAVVADGDHVSFRELTGRAQALAGRLRARGVGPEVRVGVCAERSVEMVVGLLAVLEAGGAYVPIDPSHPAERLAYILADSRVPVLLVQPHLLRELPARAGAVPTLALDRPARSGRGAGKPAGPVGASRDRVVAPESLAYVIYTSGSTGRPKGAMNAHRGIVNRLLWMRDSMGVGGGDRFLQKTPFSFDVSVWELFVPLVTGARLVMARPGGHRDPAYLADTVEREGITTIHFVPSLFQSFVEQPRLAERGAALRRVVASGEALPPALRDRFRERLGEPLGVELHNLYGPTETAVEVTERDCSADPPGAPVTLGRPLPNVRIHTADPGLRAIPAGVPGELLIGGVQVGRGYLDRPALTAEQFVPDPFAGVPGARLYRTGDLARWLPAGEIEYLGRIDHQVKVRGFRIELGEIEAVLADHPAVREATVVAVGDGGAGARLAAYLVPAGEPPAAADLRDHLRSRLPEYMIPAAFTALDALPLTPSGKVDRRALPAPSWGAGEGAGPGAEPRTPVEEVVAATWAEILELDRVGRDEDFFELGGHSLLATRVVAALHDALGVELALLDLFDAPTVAGLAGKVEARGTEDAAAPPPIRPLRRDGAGPCRFPLSPAQERLWLVERLDPDSPQYNVPAALRLRGALDAALLARALRELVRRHEALRTVLGGSDEAPVQVVLPAAPTGPAVVDLTALPDRARREAAARRLARQEGRRPFDLVRGPLFRSALVRLESGEHLLLLAFHHIVSDGWSVDVFLRELAALYRAFGAGRQAPLAELPPPPVQYGDFAAWQRELLASGLLDRELAFWREAMAGAPPVLELPADRPRPAARSLAGGRVPVRLPEPVARGLRAVARRRGGSLFMALVAVYDAFLARHGAGDDLVVGSAVTGRDRTELEGVLGFFVNLLPVRVRVPPEATVDSVVEGARNAVLAAHAHRHVSFERLVEELRPARGTSHTPLVQTTLTLEESPAALELPDVTVEALDVEIGTAKFDLHLALRREGEGLAGSLEFDRDLFDPTTAIRFARRFELLAEAVAGAGGGLTVAELPVLGPAELHQVAHEWNATRADFPRRETVHGAFRAVAGSRPDAVALEMGGETVSYGELAGRSARLARWLRAQGVGPEVPVGLATGRSADLVVGMVAVLQAGGLYVPLDPEYPLERLAFMVRDTGLRVILAHDDVAPGLPETGARVVSMARALREAAGEPASPPEEASGPAHLAYAMYTSGSTGRPKGVAIPHRAILRLVLGTDYVRLAPGDRVTQAANASFDAATFEVWGPLLTAGTVVGTDREATLEPAALSRWLARERVTSLFLTTALFDQLSLDAPEGLASLREVLFGGEAVDPARVRGVLRASPPERLLHVYGPTESTTFATWHTVAEVPPGAVTVPIGRPIANTTLHLVDPGLRRVPVGVAGELLIGGEGLARGYLGRPVVTAKRFVPDPSSPEPGARCYCTGDLARLRPDGAVEFLGRIDQQVKIRGFRIEPGEVEAALGSLPAVAEAVVLVHEDLPGGRGLVGYVVAAGDADGAAPEALRAALRERLPDFMVPSFFVPVPALPLTPNGKVDRRALRETGREHLSSGAAGAGGVAPRTATEKRLVRLWEEVLGIDGVGVEDDFFDLGGHSLLATRLVARIRSAFGVELPLRALFESSTVAALAGLLEGRTAEEDGEPPLEPLPREPGEAPELPASFSQQRLWFLDRLDPGSTVYNVPSAFRISGPLRADVLRRALTEVDRRHEVLRTTLPERGGEPVQRIAPPAPVPLPLVDLAGLPEARRTPEARELAAAEARRPFDLAGGPLLRAFLVRIGRGGHLFVLDQHHAVTDGWSVGALAEELGAFYGAFARGDRPELPALPVQYGDFAAWERRRLSGDRLERRLAYWREHLGGVPVLELPLDRPRPAVQTFEGRVRATRLPAAAADGLRGVAREEGATLFMALLAGFAALLGRVSGQDDFAVGTPVAGRPRRELESLIGFFVNTLALRVDLSGEPGFRELLRRTREAVLDGLAHQDVPFERLVEELVPERDLARPPLFQVGFALQEPPAVPELPGLEVEPVSLEHRTARFDLGLVAVERAGGLDLSIGFNTALFDTTRIERMLGHVGRLLEEAAARPDTPVERAPLLPPAERHQLLAEWNEPAAGCPLRPPALAPEELLDRQAARTPDAVALTARNAREPGGTASLTYGGLARRVDALARELRRRGAGPEALVGVSVARSLDAVVALLAVLRAGGAYVPLDPAYPAERLAFIAADSGLDLLVADRPSAEALAPALAQRRVRTLLVGGVDSGGAAGSSPGADPGSVPGSAGRRWRPTPVDSAAYVIYTSGSTGVPKGVVGTRRAVGHLLFERRRNAVGPGDRVLHKTPVSFDASVFELFSPLSAGATAVLARPGGEQDPAYQARLMAEERITVTGCTPSMLATLLEQPELAACRSLRRMAVGSEAVPLELAERYLALGLSDLYNLYGPTETTVAVLEHRARSGSEEGTLPVGRPIAAARVHVVNARGEPVPAGIPGELLVAGPGVTRGYLGRPAATAERFVPDPFAGGAGEPGGRMYRTGDLVRRRRDGAVEFLGRIDRQVKVRGFRIELGEVEEALLEHRGVVDAAVVAREAEPEATRRLVAFVVPQDGAGPDTASLREHLEARLPAYMVPSAFLLLEELPLTPSGKVDRRALASVDPGESAVGAQRSSPFVAPRDRLEADLAAVWRELLDVERVGVEDDFFELGGHSLLAVRLVSRIAEISGRELPLATLFQAPTVAEQAALLRGASLPEAASHLVPLETDGSRPPLFLVHAVGGSVFPYRDLARRLTQHSADGSEARQPVFGLQSRGLGPGAEPDASVEAMADAYLAALRAVPGSPPYRLAGWSFGALVAYEMARRLAEEGEPVELLALVDPALPGRVEAPPDASPEEPEAVRSWLLVARDLVALAGVGLDLNATEVDAAPEAERLDLVARRVQEAGALPSDLGSADVRRILRVYRANVEAARAYRPAPLRTAGPRSTLALLAEESTAAEGLPRWQELLGAPLEVRRFPGDHYELLRPPAVEPLAAALASALDRLPFEGASGERRRVAAADE